MTSESAGKCIRAAMDAEDVLRAFQQIKASYKIGFTLKDEQVEILAVILNNKDAFAVLPTGFGKSMCYILPPLLLDEVRHSLSH